MNYPVIVAALTFLALVGWLSNYKEPTFLGSVLVLSLGLAGVLADLLLPADILLRHGAFGSVQIWAALMEFVITMFITRSGYAHLRESEAW